MPGVGYRAEAEGPRAGQPGGMDWVLGRMLA